MIISYDDIYKKLLLRFRRWQHVMVDAKLCLDCPSFVGAAYCTADTAKLDEKLLFGLQVVMRNTNQRELTELPARKYLWVRRTSRRAYNQHMHKMRDGLDEMDKVPVFVIVGSVVGLAVCLCLFVK